MEKPYHYSHVGSTRKVGEVDLESGEFLFPGISAHENQLRWGFIRKVYGILSAQILLTAAISFLTVLYAPINELLRANSGILLVLIFLPFILGSLPYKSIKDSNLCCIWPLHAYQQKHPHNLIFLGLFSASLSITVGFTCANTEGKIVLEALVLTAAVVCSLTAYTFWASRKGKDFSHLGPFLFTCLSVLILTSVMQMFFPLGPASHAIYGGIGAIVFSGYIIYDTDNLIKRYDYDQYIWASVTLYLDILNLFLEILRVLRQSNN